MPRTLLIVPDDDRGPLHWVDLAEREGASEIVSGIPPALADVLDGRRLPFVYVEPDPEPVPAPEPVPTTPAQEFVPMSWATAAQARLDAQQQVLDLLLLGDVPPPVSGGGLDDLLTGELPDSGGSLDDLDGLDDLSGLGLPDSGLTLDDLPKEN